MGPMPLAVWRRCRRRAARPPSSSSLGVVRVSVGVDRQHGEAEELLAVRRCPLLVDAGDAHGYLFQLLDAPPHGVTGLPVRLEDSFGWDNAALALLPGTTEAGRAGDRFCARVVCLAAVGGSSAKPGNRPKAASSTRRLPEPSSAKPDEWRHANRECAGRFKLFFLTLDGSR